MSSPTLLSKTPEEIQKSPSKRSPTYQNWNTSSPEKSEYQSAKVISHNEDVSTEDTELKPDHTPQPTRGSVHEFDSHFNQQNSFRIEAQDIEEKIQYDFPWHLPLLYLDLLLALYGWHYSNNHWYPEQTMFPFFISGIVAGIYSKKRLDITGQLYSCIVYILMMLWSLQSLYTIVMIAYKSYWLAHYWFDHDQAYFHSGIAVTLILHMIITLSAFELKKLMNERETLLAGVNLKTNLQTDSEWQQLNDLESQGQLSNKKEILSRFERVIESELSLESTLTYFGLLLLFFWGFSVEGFFFGTNKAIMVFLAAGLTGLAAKLTLRSFQQICCFTIIFAMTLTCFYPVCTHIMRLLYFCPDCTIRSFITDVFIIVPVIWSPSVIRNTWRLAKLMKERECVANHFERFHNIY